jgi:hypothetical protein
VNRWWRSGLAPPGSLAASREDHIYFINVPGRIVLILSIYRRFEFQNFNGVHCQGEPSFLLFRAIGFREESRYAIGAGPKAEAAPTLFCPVLSDRFPFKSSVDAIRAQPPGTSLTLSGKRQAPGLYYDTVKTLYKNIFWGEHFTKNISSYSCHAIYH